MDRATIEKLEKLLKGKDEGSFTEKLLSEIYSEVNQARQKQDEMLRLLIEWQAKES